MRGQCVHLNLVSETPNGPVLVAHLPAGSLVGQGDAVDCVNDLQQHQKPQHEEMTLAELDALISTNDTRIQSFGYITDAKIGSAMDVHTAWGVWPKSVVTYHIDNRSTKTIPEKPLLVQPGTWRRFRDTQTSVVEQLSSALSISMSTFEALSASLRQQLDLLATYNVEAKQAVIELSTCWQSLEKTSKALQAYLRTRSSTNTTKRIDIVAEAVTTVNTLAAGYSARISELAEMRVHEEAPLVSPDGWRKPWTELCTYVCQTILQRLGPFILDPVLATNLQVYASQFDAQRPATSLSNVTRLMATMADIADMPAPVIHLRPLDSVPFSPAEQQKALVSAETPYVVRTLQTAMMTPDHAIAARIFHEACLRLQTLAEEAEHNDNAITSLIATRDARARDSAANHFKQQLEDLRTKTFARLDEITASERDDTVLTEHERSFDNWQSAWSAIRISYTMAVAEISCDLTRWFSAFLDCHRQTVRLEEEMGFLQNTDAAENVLQQL